MTEVGLAVAPVNTGTGRAADESAPLSAPLSGSVRANEASDGGVYNANRRFCCSERYYTAPEAKRRNVIIIAVLVSAAVIGLITVVALASTDDGDDNTPMSESDYEQMYLSSQNSDRLRANMFYYTNESHIAGSVMDYDRAVYTQQKMLEYGIPEVRIERFNVLLSYPISRALAIVDGAPLFTASLKEDVLPSDPTSGKPSVDTFLSYSASGDVTACLVYANYGSFGDYAQLDSIGVSVSGCVVIARYGEIFRGNIVSNAEVRGAVGVLIYSDPADDAPQGQSHVYPNSPGWRPPSGVQRGTIWNGNGDPLTPGYPSIDEAPRITMDQAFMANHSYGTPMSRIPSLPIGYGDAEPFLRALAHGNATFPSHAIPAAGWKGGLNITYAVGPGTIRVRLAVQMQPKQTDIWNVIARIPGAIEPDRTVILGNHRDAWTFGAGDPNSGSTTMLEVAAGLGNLLSNGWRPRRSIVLCSWDAEEYALIGSVEHVESHEKTLMAGAIAYLNVDVGVSTTATLQIGGTPSLAAMIRTATHDIAAPAPYTGTGYTLYDMWSWSQNGGGPTNGPVPNPVPVPILNAAGMGTGSDYGGFVQHIGVPSVDMRFADEPNPYSGVYHSNYDSYTWISSNWADPNFIYHGALAQIWGLMAMRLADTPLLPFKFLEYSNILQADIIALEVSYGPTTAANLNFTTLKQAGTEMITISARLDTALTNIGLQANGLTELQLRMWNDKITGAERSFLWLQGVTGREWYRHMVWVAGLYDVYGSTAFSTITDAMAVQDTTDAQIQIQMAAIALTQFNSFLRDGGLAF